MDPVYEQRLRDEVIYLHSLWHQGPPRATATAGVRHHLPASQATQLKKQKKPINKNRKTTTITASGSSSEWPCPAASPSTTGWPASEPQLPPPPEQHLKFAQKKALKIVREFLNVDDSDAIYSSSDDDDELTDERSFFDKVFKEDTDLREYYEKGFANGEFSCLVCGALGGKKSLKKFKGCLALVQHSIAINSNKRRAHRAFGQAVCNVLGWDLDRLPDIVSMLTEGKCSSDIKEGSSMSLVNIDTLDGKNDEALPEISPHGDEGDLNSAIRATADAAKNLEDCASDGLTIGNSSGYYKESSSMALVNNFDSVNNDTLKSKLDEAASDSGCTGSRLSLHGDEGDMNSMTCPNAGKNLEDCGVVLTQNVEERASNGLTINSLAFPDADGNMENLGMSNRDEGGKSLHHRVNNLVFD